MAHRLRSIDGLKAQVTYDKRHLNLSHISRQAAFAASPKGQAHYKKLLGR